MKSPIITKFVVAVIVGSIVFDTQSALAFQILTKGKGSTINTDTIIIDNEKRTEAKSTPITLNQKIGYSSKWYKYKLGIGNGPDIYIEVNNKLFPPKDISTISLTYSGKQQMQEIEQGLD